jgi:prepilin-type processing-associated H-X9-DG protein
VQVNPHIESRSDVSSLSLAGFTRLELLVVVGVCCVLAAIQVPIMGRSREPGNVAICANNLRQLSTAMLMYSADNDGTLTPHSSRYVWPVALLPYYRQTNVLHCPSDAPKPLDFGTSFLTNYVGPRSYLLNGFNEYTNSPGGGVPLKAIQYLSETILFGEKDTRSGHWWFDYNEYDDAAEVEHARHLEGSFPLQRGGSNYGFADGSVRFLKPGQSFNPIMLWGINDETRVSGVPF